MVMLRNGFVSNSSSSSFLIYGADLDIDDFMENFYALRDVIIKKLSKGTSTDKEDAEWWQSIPDGMNSEEIRNYLEERDFDIFEFILEYVLESIEESDEELETHNVDCEFFYIGKCPSEIGDYETGWEFKVNVKNRIKKLFPELDNKKFGFYEECWFNG